MSSIDDSDFESGREKENKMKNQNPEILPHGSYRAYITSQPKGYGCYVNAVYINSYRTKDFFLATQEPLSHTVDDYLRLLFDRKVGTVVSLEPSSYLAKHPQKFGQHLPMDTDKPLETDLFTVKLDSINDARADIVIRQLTITYKMDLNKDSHTFKHFQANFWQDGDYTADTAETLTQLLEQIDRWREVTERDVVCVTCRDGNERTGIFISVWNALDRLKTEQEVDVFHTVELIRMVRPQFIVNEEHYGFIYHLLYSYLQEFDLYANFK